MTDDAVITNSVSYSLLMWFVTDDEGSGSDVGKKFTKCSTCKYGAECDEDSEDVWWVLDFEGRILSVCAGLFQRSTNQPLTETFLYEQK